MERNSLLDNTKLVMIFFVVFGHSIETLLGRSEILDVIYKTIYSFHMPVFVFVSGLLTNKKALDESKLIKTILIPFFVFTLLYEIPEYLLKGTLGFYSNLLIPYWFLWYLISLFCWRVMAPFFLKFRYPMIIAILLTLIAGCFDSIGYELGLSRTIYFFPFFLFGYHYNFEKFSQSKLFNISKIICWSLILLNVCLFTFFTDIKHFWLYGSFSYNQMRITICSALFIRLGMMFLSFVMIIAVINLMTNKKVFFTKMGANSLYIYVWHGFLIKLLLMLHFFSYIINNFSIYAVLISLVMLSVLIVYILSFPLVKKITQKIILNPISRVLLIKS